MDAHVPVTHEEGDRYPLRPPFNREKAMFYCYYLTEVSRVVDEDGTVHVYDQVSETKDHVNAFWVADTRQTKDELVTFSKSGKAVILDLCGCLYDGLALRSDAKERLANLYNYIKENGNIDSVKLVVPCDEPNLPQSDRQEYLVESVRLIRETWPNISVGCNYYNDGKFLNHHLFDVVSFDDYLGGFGIFLKPRWWERIKLFFGKFVRRGSYLRLVEKLRPDQMTMFFPGGTYEEDPTKWVEFAKTQKEVFAFVPFLWASTVDGNTELKGIRANKVRDLYIKAGHELTKS